MPIDRRQFFQASAALGASVVMPAPLLAAQKRKEQRIDLIASAFTVALDPGNALRAAVWGFNERLPGPRLRFRRGDSVHLVVRNDLPQETAVHWHGLRVPNAMDGVAHVTQQPIAPGGSFDYRFELRDSGTYWYHARQGSFDQAARGLFGTLIVEEEKPPRVDREEVWVLSDMKLDPQRQPVEDFGGVGDIGDIANIASDERVGNQILVNGLVAGAQRKIEVRAGERLRLRLINAAAARVFRLAIDDHPARVIAFDGQGVTPHPLPVDGLALGPGMRADLIIDCMASPARSFKLRDLGREPAAASVLGTLAYSAQPALRNKPLTTSVALAPNRIAEPNLARASEHSMVFQDGLRGMPVIGLVDGKPARIKELTARQEPATGMNDEARQAAAPRHEPLLRLKKGEHVRLRMVNETGFFHPMHLHGHFFRVLAIEGQATPHREWRDTVIMGPRQSIDIAFVADNPGEWMHHGHILDHAAGDMMGTIVVE